MEALLPLLLQLLGGLGGGNALAATLKKLSLGPLGNTLTGLLGGLAGGQLTGLLNLATSGGDITAILGNLVGGGLGGALLTLVVGLIKNAVSKK